MELIEIALKSLTKKGSDEKFFTFWETLNIALMLMILFYHDNGSCLGVSTKVRCQLNNLLSQVISFCRN